MRPAISAVSGGCVQPAPEKLADVYAPCVRAALLAPPSTPPDSGLPVASGSPAPAVQPTPGTQRLSQEVHVANAARGCRWQHSADPAVHIADCGDENEPVRVVFQNGRATEYRVIAVQDPNRLPPSGQSGVASAVSVLPRNPAGNSAPLRVNPNAGG